MDKQKQKILCRALDCSVDKLATAIRGLFQPILTTAKGSEIYHLEAFGLVVIHDGKIVGRNNAKTNHNISATKKRHKKNGGI